MSVTKFTSTKTIRQIRSIPNRLKKILSEYRFYAYLAVLGPGIIAASAGNDVSGIATYSAVGAAYGYTLLWVFIPIVLSLIMVQEMCVRMGIVTGQGLADLIREQFGVRWTAFVMLALLIANAGVIVANFVGIAQASEMFGVTRYVSVPLAGALIWWLVIKGSHERVERVFLAMSLVFVCYVFAAFMAKPDWNEVLTGFTRPTVSTEPAYMFMLIALIGTTITPFMQVYVQSTVVEKGLDEDDLPMARLDVIIGTAAAVVVSVFIVISTAATLHGLGITELSSAATAAEALVPVVGVYAKYLFAIGLFGAAMIAMGVLPLATAYSMSEALGFEKGLSRSFREAPIFIGIFTGLLIFGALIALIPGIPQMELLLLTQCINGLLLPVTLIAIVKLAGNKEIMGEHANRPIMNFFAWATAIIVSILSVILIFESIYELL